MTAVITAIRDMEQAGEIVLGVSEGDKTDG